MPSLGQISIDGKPWNLAAASLLPRGKRAYRRTLRSSQPGDPAQSRVAVWALSGPIGPSRERGGVLGHDHSNLETRYDALLTSLAARSTLDLSTQDPLSSGTASLGALPLGARALGGGSSAAVPHAAEHIDADRDYLFPHRGAFSTQVDPSDWSVVHTWAHQALVRGAVPWFGKGRVALGSSVKLQTRSGVTASGARYEDTDADISGVYAKALSVGNDRLWLADASSANENRLRYSLDDLAAISNAFRVGDPRVDVNGLGKLGPFTLAGKLDGVFSFTEEGLPVPLTGDVLDAAQSTENGRQMAQIWGWAFVITDIGLYALRPGVANPVGIGTDKMQDFEGFEGRPTAVRAWRESLLVAYLDSAGTTARILRGVFGRETAGTGQPDLYPFQELTAEVRVIGATSVPSSPTVVWVEGASTLGRAIQGRGGRDIDDANYVFSTAGGQWHGSTLMRDDHLRKFPRWGRFTTESCDATNTWRLAISPDEAAYVNVGAAVQANGVQTVRPATGSPLSPDTSLSGFTIKPRLTQVAANSSSSSSPPQIRGTLEIGYDERPDHVLETAFVLQLERPADMATLEAFLDGADANGQTPVAVVLPGESSFRYGFVTLVQVEDLVGDAVLGAALSIVLWDVS